MKKKLFFKFSDSGDASGIVMTLDAAVAWIKGDDLKNKSEDELKEYEYLLQPVLMTDEEFENLPEASI